jgi:hypothetical protein
LSANTLQQFKGVRIFSVGQTIRFNWAHLRLIFNKSFCCLICLKGSIGTDLLSVWCITFPALWDKSDLLDDFLEEATPGSEGQNFPTGRIFRGNCSEKQFKWTRLLSGQCPPTSYKDKWHWATRDSSKWLHKWGNFSKAR